MSKAFKRDVPASYFLFLKKFKSTSVVIFQPPKFIIQNNMNAYLENIYFTNKRDIHGVQKYPKELKH